MNAGLWIRISRGANTYVELKKKIEPKFVCSEDVSALPGGLEASNISPMLDTKSYLWF
jgi:hypothetical protein